MPRTVERDWTKSSLIDRCERFRASVRHRKLATDEELERAWPEDGERARKGEWIKCYADLRSYMRRAEWLDPDSEHAEDELLKALRDEPQSVKLTTGDEVFVYPKSHDALRWFQFHGWLTEWLDSRVAAMEAAADGDLEELRGATDEPVTVLEAARRELSLQLALFCWAATHPEPGLPWEPTRSDLWGSPSEGPPAEFLDLPPVDIVRLNAVFLRVNVRGLAYLKRLSEGSKNGKRNPWDVFFANRSKQVGQPSRYLMMHESLCSQLAEATLSAPDFSDLEG